MNLNMVVSLTGLLLDICGAWFVARGLIKRSVEDIRMETGLIYDGAPYIISGLIQKVDSMFGFGLLFTGFITGVWIYHPSKR